MKNVLALILAGGKGTRLEPLTQERAKPAVPFGGAYRIIDFTLSNCINSGIRRVFLLTQYKAASLDRHVNLGWRFLSRELQEFVDILPPQQRINEEWYRGTADAVYQNIYSIENAGPDHVLILSGDHIYQMDYAALVEGHVRSQAKVTIACLPVSLAEGTQFGVMQIDEEYRVRQFVEKPKHPQPMPNDPERCLASMGIYVFDTRFLFEELCHDALNPRSHHDFGKDIIPSIIDKHRVSAFPFCRADTGEQHYWRDVGTIDAYYEANMDLLDPRPQLNLYDPARPVRTYHPQLPPPKFIASSRDPEKFLGNAVNSMVGGGSIIAGGSVRHSILAPRVDVRCGAVVEDSILFEGVTVGEHAKLRRVIVDKHVSIPDGTEVGFDPIADEARGFTVTESGITVIGKEHHASWLETR